MSEVILTVQQIMDLAEFAGLTVGRDDPDVDLDTEFTVVADGMVAADDDGLKSYSGPYAYCTDYPEEGCLPLNDNIIDSPRTAT